MTQMLRLALLSAAMIAAPANAADETIAVFTKNLANPHFQGVRVGTEAAARAFGVRVIQIRPDQADSIPEQLRKSRT